MDDLRIMQNLYRLEGIPSVQDMGSNDAVSIHCDRVLPEWVLGIITHGRMFACIGEEDFGIGAGEYYLMPPGLRHYGTRESPHGVFYFTFRMASRRLPGGEGLSGISLPVFGGMPPEIDARALHSFMRRGRELGYLDREGVDAQLLALLWQMSAEFARRRETGDRAGRLAAQIHHFLSDRPGRLVKSEELVRAFHYSYGHLDRVFRRRFGTSIMRRHAELRMRRAAELLRTGSSIKEAASRLGFSDYYHFLRVFKRVRGCTPRQAIC
jgi:AraC-like DNA-binding protein